MKTFLKQSLLAAFTAATFFVSAAASADDTSSCVMHDDAYYTQHIQGVWHMSKMITEKNAEFELTVNFAANHTFHSTMAVTSKEYNTNVAISSDGTWNVNNGSLEMNLGAIDNDNKHAHKSFSIFCMSDDTLTINTKKEPATFTKVG